MPHMRTYALSEQRQWRPQALRGTSRAVTPVYVVSTDVGAGGPDRPPRDAPLGPEKSTTAPAEVLPAAQPRGAGGS